MLKHFNILVYCAVLGLTVACTNEPCYTEEPELTLTFLDTNGQVVSSFDEVYAISQNEDYNEPFNGIIDLDLSSQQTIYVFKKDQRTNSLIFNYERTLNAGEKDGYCLFLTYLDVQSPTLTINCYSLENEFSFFPTKNCPPYAVSVSY